MADPAGPDASLDPFLAVLDRLPFVASLKKDMATLKRLVVRRRAPRLACTGDVHLGRSVIGTSVFGDPGEERQAARPAVSEVPKQTEAAGEPATHWTRLKTARGMADWSELRLASASQATAQQAVTLSAGSEPADVVTLVLTPALFESADLDLASASAIVRSLGVDDKTPAPLVVLWCDGADTSDLPQRANDALDKAGLSPVRTVVVPGEGSADRDSAMAEVASAIFEVLPDEAKLEAARLFVRVPSARRGVAHRVVQSCSTLALTVGLAPVPLSDTVLIFPLQLMMVSVIAYLGGRDLDRKAAAEWIASLGVVGGAGLGLRWAAQQLAKLVPGAGTVVSGTVAGAGTVALGQSAIAYFLERSSKQLVDGQR